MADDARLDAALAAARERVPSGGAVGDLCGSLDLSDPENPSGRLPALKVEDPSALVARLREGKKAGVLSTKRRMGRVNQPQLLVNKGAPCSVFAVVEQREPVEFVGGIASAPEGILDGVPDEVLKRFATAKSFFFLPLDLNVVFDEPLALVASPAGLSMAQDVDLGRDLVRKLDAAEGDEAKLVVTNTPSAAELRGMPERDLVRADRLLHGLFAREFVGNDATESNGVGRIDVVAAHVAVMREVRRRGLNLPEDDALAEATVQAKVEKREDGWAMSAQSVVKALGSTLPIDGPAVYLVGEACQKACPSAVEFLVRGAPNAAALQAIQSQVLKALPAAVAKRAVFIADDGGPMDEHIPLFDLALTPRSDAGLVGFATKQEDEALVRYPSSPGMRAAVLQMHFRGASAHADLRMSLDEDSLVGWTLAVQRAGKVPKVDSVEQGRAIAAMFDVDGSEMFKPLLLPSRVLAVPKKLHPAEWLDMGDAVLERGEVGATPEDAGVFIEVARLSAEWGLQKPFSHEYFLTNAGSFSGLLFVRRLRNEAAPEAQDEGLVEPGEEFWAAGLGTSLLPGVLKPEAVRTNTMPPLGQSAMPTSLMDETPPEFRFWEADTEEEALEARNALVRARLFRESDITIDDGQFAVVSRKVAVGPFVPRDDHPMLAKQDDRRDFTLALQKFESGRVVRHLVIADKHGAVDYQLQGDPLGGDTVVATAVEAKREMLGVSGAFGPGDECAGVRMNETAGVGSVVTVVETGKALMLHGDMVRFEGKNLKGVFSLKAEDGVGAVWLLRAASNPERAERPDARPTIEPGTLRAAMERAKKLKPKARQVKLLKRAEGDDGPDEERYVFGAVLIPNEVDAQGDIYSVEEVRKACHAYMEHFGHKNKVMHKGQPVEGVKVIENYVTKSIETHGNAQFPIGTWMIAVRVVDDELWEAVKRGELNGFSMGGTAVREKLAA